MEIIFGAIVSLIAQLFKKFGKTEEYITLSIVIALALIAAGVYTILTSFGYYESFRNILITAGAFYVFIIKRFKTK